MDLTAQDMMEGQQPQGLDVQRMMDQIERQQLIGADAGLRKWVLEPQDVIKEIEHYLKGTVRGPKGMIKAYDPIMNDKGINKMLMLIRSHLNKIFSLSTFDNKEIIRMCREVRLSIIDELFQHHKTYGVAKSFKSPIVMSIDHMVNAYLKQALNGGMQQFLATTERRVENIHTHSNVGEDGMVKPKGMSLFGGLFKK